MYLNSKHNDTKVVFVRMIITMIKKVMINTCSFADILYYDTFQKLGLTTNDFISMTSSLTRFIGNSPSKSSTCTSRSRQSHTLRWFNFDQVYDSEHPLNI